MENFKENKMGVMSINKLLLNMSIPMMISMLVQALYNVVDSVFVSMIDENALAAVSLAFPMQNLMIAVASGTAVGVKALLSKSLGEKNFDRANKAAKNGIFLALVSYILFLLFGIFGAGAFIGSQTKDPIIVAYGTSYLRICSILSVGIFCQIMLETLIQSTGKTFYSMITQGVGAIINLIFDPIMIFGLFGFPRLGVAGAALATVFGQCVACVVGVYFNVKKNREININMKDFRPDGNTIKRIYAVGAPSIIMMSISSLMTYCINKILIAFTATATAVFGVYFKLQSFIFMPVFGLNNGMVPIVAYNYGAKNKERITKTIKLSMIYAVSIMVIGCIAFQIFPRQLLMMFNASENMLAIGVPALRIISLSFLLAGFCIICGSVFQALGNGLLSLWVSIARQLVALVPIAYLLSLMGEVTDVWWSFPLAELVSFSLSITFMFHVYKKEIKPLGE